MLPPFGQMVLGTASLGLSGTREEAYALLDAFVEEGGAVIDSAAVYSDWVPGEARRSEGIIGEWLTSRARRADIFISTKGAHPPLTDMGRSRLDAASIAGDVEESLRRLQVERIDLFYLHRDDVGRPVAEILGVLARLVEQGKLASVGLSNWTSARIAAARRAGILPIASNQVLGNVLCRHMSPPRDPSVLRLDGMALADAEATDSSLFLFSSQCGGYLGKRLTQPDAGPAEYRNPVADAAALAIGEVARGKGVDPTNLAVAFLLAFSPNIFPIVGPRTIAQVRHSMAAARLRLTPAEIAEIARISGFSDWRQPAAD